MPSMLLACLLLVPALAPCAANATDFPVSGTISVNGNPGTLPAGGVFGGSGYNTSTGEIAAGVFSFPVATTSFNSSFGNVVVTYQLSQLNSSSGQVATDGVAALSDATLKLQVLSASLGGVIPIDVGTCVFQPIDIILIGTGSAGGLDLADAAFTIPTVASTDCGGNGDAINTGIAGSNNSIQMHLDGDFTPPPQNDTIFANGFDPAG
jgi:hypothetical protein